MVSHQSWVLPTGRIAPRGTPGSPRERGSCAKVVPGRQQGSDTHIDQNTIHEVLRSVRAVSAGAARVGVVVSIAGTLGRRARVRGGDARARPAAAAAATAPAAAAAGRQLGQHGVRKKT